MSTKLHAVPALGRRYRVLVVDDNLDFVRTTRFLLQDSGHDVQFAINGFAALDLARTFQPDVILLDMKLPDFSGPEIARQLKWELPNARFIAVSAVGDEIHRRKAKEVGCEEYHVKPIDPTVLDSIIRGPTTL